MLGYITEKKIPLAILIFFAVISQGAYFAVPLIIINIFFICAIILRLRKNDIAVDANAIFFVAFFIIMCVSFAFSFSVGDGITELLRYLLFPLSYIYFYNQKNPKNISDI
ncbi:MAG: hypothetical protein FWD01_02825, partial [Defluviitaleaceae bacterium]|nr:hypothetical protein [Defluviitaleaceae bacterium]